MPVSSCLVIMIISATSTIFIFHLCTYVQISQNNKYLIGNLRNQVLQDLIIFRRILLCFFTQNLVHLFGVLGRKQIQALDIVSVILLTGRGSPVSTDHGSESLLGRRTRRVQLIMTQHFSSPLRGKAFVLSYLSPSKFVLLRSISTFCSTQRELRNIFVMYLPMHNLSLFYRGKMSTHTPPSGKTEVL